MARHKKKKKKFPPTPDPQDSSKKQGEQTKGLEEEKQEEEKNTPTIEKKDLPPTEFTGSEVDKNLTKRQIDKLFWLRIGLAVLAGTAATFLFDSIEGEERRWASIIFMIVIFIVSIGIAKGMKIRLPSSDKKKIVTTGIGSYIFIYLFMWIMTYSLVNISENGSGIPTPFT